ncbi:hypothetical protein BZA70DRAFT_274996 [Myxozyma melibiosi]|uniref:GPI ethanolamine phosphate transferase 3 n=1 Tax=Myxozyma melibiosi TaxID=54550 RepID=A0ABR1FA86_9ASCO
MAKESDKSATKAVRKNKAKLDRSGLLSTIVPVWFLLLNVAGLALFSLGFLLTRPVLPDIAVKSETYSDPAVVLPKPFQRVVFILIDALREDFITGSAPADSYISTLVTPAKYAESQPENAAVFKFIADPPTTTLQRLKALTTGSLPTFIDAGSNFNGAAILEDSWVSQLLAKNGFDRIAFAGDDTWVSLFPALLNGTDSSINKTFPYESFNVLDIHTVDNGVTAHLAPLLERRSEWDVLIGHYLGVDHTGHRYGPNTEVMKDKLAQMDDVVKSVISAIEDDEDTLLVVLGDHGMDEKGDHGGDSKGEIEAGLFIYSSRPFLAPSDEITTVNQIDIVPTLSLLLDIPIPFNSLGSPIASVFKGPKSDFHQLASASRIVSEQINSYRSRHPSFANSTDVSILFNEANLAWVNQDYEKASSLYLAFQSANVNACRDMWARFDLVSMTLGIALLVATFATMIAFYAIFNGDSACASDYLSMFFKRIVLGTAIGTLGGYGSTEFVLSDRTLIVTVFGASVGSLLGFLSCLLRMRKSLPSISLPSKWTTLALVYTAAHGMLFASNSYVVWETRSLSYLLVTFGFILLAASFGITDPIQRGTTVYNSVMFIILARAAEYPKLCREEQLPFCTSNFYSSPDSSVSSVTVIIILFLVPIVLPSVIRSFLRTSASDEGSAKAWIGAGLRLALALVGLYWTLDYAEMDPRSITAPEDIRPFKYMISRLLIGIALIGGPLAWFRASPLCLRVEMTNNQELIKRAAEEGDIETVEKTKPVSVEILGFANAYGSLYLLLFLCLYAGVALCNKPMGGIALAGMIYQILTLLEISDALDIPQKSVLLIPTILGLMGTQYYFATGHQATLVSIQWDVAFLFTETTKPPLPHIALILNTFGPYILAGFAAPLSVLYKLSPSPKDFRASEITLSKVLRSSIGMMIYTTLLTVINFVMTAVLRRHLMVWKIFAPRFMLAGGALIAVDVAVVLATYAGAKSVSSIFDVFG